jgi:hypothetical protein
MQSATPCLRPVLVLPRSLHSSASRIACGRGAGTSRSIFLLRTRLVSWPVRTRVNILDPVRLALPRPPNLESQYRRVGKSCQEKNAKCGELFKKMLYQ